METLRIAIISVDGSEITETIAPLDIFRRAGIEFVTFGKDFFYHQPAREISSLMETAKELEFSALVFPGGKRGVQKVKEDILNNDIGQFVISWAKSGKLIAAICAAPSILGELGLLKGRKYTCYPGWQSDSFGGTYMNNSIAVDGNLITGRSMYYSTDFGLEIVEYLLGKEKRIEIEKQVKGII